jgi:hypothetical protein
MKRFLLTLGIAIALTAVTSSTAQAQYGYFGTFGGGGRNVSFSHVRSFGGPGNIYIQSYAPPPGYGYYGEAYGGYRPAYGYGAAYGNGPNCRHYGGYGPYNYGGYPGGSIRW